MGRAELTQLPKERSPRLWWLHLSQASKAKKISLVLEKRKKKKKLHLSGVGNIWLRVYAASRARIRLRASRIQEPGRVKATGQASGQRVPAGLTNCKQMASNETDSAVAKGLFSQGLWVAPELLGGGG